MIESLEKNIEMAFNDKTPHRYEIVPHFYNYKDCEYKQTYHLFKNKSWIALVQDLLKDGEIKYYPSALNFMTIKSKLYYLKSYMIFSLRVKDAKHASETKGYLEKILSELLLTNNLSPQQIKVTKDYLKWLELQYGN